MDLTKPAGGYHFMNPTDTPRTDAFGNNLVKCYCPRCIVGAHDDIQLAAQYRANAHWRERAEKAEALVKQIHHYAGIIEGFQNPITK